MSIVKTSSKRKPRIDIPTVDEMAEALNEVFGIDPSWDAKSIECLQRNGTSATVLRDRNKHIAKAVVKILKRKAKESV